MNYCDFSLQLLESSPTFSPGSCSTLSHFDSYLLFRVKTNNIVTEVMKTGLSQTIYIY